MKKKIKWIIMAYNDGTNIVYNWNAFKKRLRIEVEDRVKE